MAAYAALTSLLQILDQLEHHPFPPISLDRQQVDSLTEIATYLQKFLEGYDSPFVDSDEADPLEMRIADAAYAAEDVIESYIVDKILFAAAATQDHRVINSEQGINSNEGTSSLDVEVNKSSGEETNNQKPKNDDNVTTMKSSHNDEVISSRGSAHILTRIWSCFFNCFRGYSPSDELNCKEEIISDEAIYSDDEVNSCSTDQVNSEEEINSDEDASSGPAGEAINISGEEISCVNFYHDVWKVIEEMDLVKKEAMEMMRGKTAVQAPHQLQRNILRSSSFSGKNSSVMVGFDDVLLQLLDKLTGGPSSLQVIPITGMGGIGKTTLARNIFKHAYVKEYFDICAWVTISQQYDTKEILSQILSQASGKWSEKSEEQELGDELHKYLFGRRYLIIMDDIWNIEVWEEMKLYFPNCENGSRVVVTTRQSFLTSQLSNSNDVFHMEFLDEVNSWKLFSKTVFGEEGFPLQLEKIGKKIVEKCGGLPLSIVVIGGLLAKSQHTHEHWAHIVHKLNSIVNLENDEYCLKILKLSYNHLPAYLKPSFLYMGIFEEDIRIRVSTLVKLWVSEGFLKPENGKSLETIGEGFLKDLIDRNLILVDGLGYTGNIKYCKMHDLLRDLCLKEAENERFYHVIRQHGPQGIQNHKWRRMVSNQSTSEERVLDALESTRSHVRSFIYRSKYDSDGLLPNFYHVIGKHGPRGIQNHKQWRMVSYQSTSDTLESTRSHVRSFVYRLLRILKAEDTRFQLEDVVKLVNSRYVAIGNTNPLESINLPSSVNFLWNLHTLRISGGKLIVAPVEIWKMSQLRHVDLEWPGYIYLPDPPSGGSIVILENLQTLKGILNFKCGEEMVKRIPNIKKLEIEYKETRRLDGDDYCLSNLHSLHQLESLTIKLVDEKDEDFLHNITFPQSLIKLSLELEKDTGVGWEEMLERIGGSLPLLQKLKLKCGVFKTGKWETVEGQFPSLKFLQLSQCDGLKQWMIEDSSHFPYLEHLYLTGLKELEEIPLEIGEIPTLQSIELLFCSKLAVKSAKKIVEEQEELQGGEEHLPFLVRVAAMIENQEALQSLASPNFQFELRRSTSTHRHPSWSNFFNCFGGYLAESHDDGGEEIRHIPEQLLSRSTENERRYVFDGEEDCRKMERTSSFNGCEGGAEVKN